MKAQMNPKKKALTDALTGLPNRHAIERLAKQELLRRLRYPGLLTLGLVDIDNFKQVNSLYTLMGGDHVLAWLSRTLTKAVRTVDTVGRVGGEEFMVVAPVIDVEGAMLLGERVCHAIANDSTTYNGAEIKVRISIGMAVLSADYQVGFDQLRDAAVDALKEAKALGGNRSVVRVVPDRPESLTG
jgi:diguanylate cyclase (GGDEF)-like protein